MPIADAVQSIGNWKWFFQGKTPRREIVHAVQGIGNWKRRCPLSPIFWWPIAYAIQSIGNWKNFRALLLRQLAASHMLSRALGTGREQERTQQPVQTATSAGDESYTSSQVNHTCCPEQWELETKSRFIVSSIITHAVQSIGNWKDTKTEPKPTNN